jgi:hypothetical protein
MKKEALVNEMSMRDYFAAKAMQGLLAANWCDQWRASGLETMEKQGDAMLVADAYAIADAMLKHRFK